MSKNRPFINKEDSVKNTYLCLMATLGNLAGTVFLLLLFLDSGGMSSSNREIVVTSENKDEINRLKLIACKKGMISVLQNEVDTNYVNTKILDLVNNPDFKRYEEDIYSDFSAVMVGENICRFIAFGSDEYEDLAIDANIENGANYKLAYGIYGFDTKKNKENI